MQGFFKLNDKSCLVELTGPAQLKLDERFSFTDEMNVLLRAITDACRLRNFSVPGFEFEFTMLRRDNTVSLFMIDCSELDFRLVSDNTIDIPKMRMNLYNDNSGSLSVYPLDDWGRDKHTFVHGKTFHLRMDNAERICLNYNYNYRGEFKANNDSRDYQPEGREPSVYMLDDLSKKFCKHLSVVLDKINTYPIPEFIPDDVLFKKPEVVKINSDLVKSNRLFAMVRKGWIADGGLSEICPGPRLLNLSVSGEQDHPLRKYMNDGFVYIIPGDDMPTDNLNTSWIYTYSNDQMIEVDLNDANGLFVIDAAIYDDLMSEFFENNPDVTRLEDAQVLKFKIKQASSMVLLNEYKGNYKKPLIISNRTINKNEILL